MNGIHAGLERHIPLWYYRFVTESIEELSAIKTLEGRDLNIAFYKDCVMGEAHGFSADYAGLFTAKTCLECHEFARELKASVMRHEEARLRGTLYEVEKHFEHKHPR